MKRFSTRSAILLMGLFSAGAFVAETAANGKPDDTLLVFAGSMFTAYALTEPKDDDHDDEEDSH